MLAATEPMPARPLRRLLLLAVLPLVLGAAPAVVADGQVAAPASTSFSGAAARQQVDALAGQIGSRPAGSASYEQAVQYAGDQLRGWGYQPRVQRFPLQTFDDRGSSLEITSGMAQPPHVAADTLVYSAAGDVEAPLVAIGGVGEPQDVAQAPADVHGAVVLIKRGSLRFSEKIANAAAAGAVGVVIYNDSQGRVQGSLSSPSSIPAVTVADDAGQQLLDGLASAPLRVRLRVDASIDQRDGSNVVADLAAARTDAPGVIFGAHLDSVPAGPGGNDDGSGSGVVLELARELAQRPPDQRPFTFHFVLFGAEELGLYGSRAYVQSLSDADRHATAAMINLDMVGVGDAWRFGGTDDLVQRALGAAADLNLRALPLRGPLAGASDHASFLDAAMPAVFLYRVEDPNYHTAGDRAELVDPTALGQAGEIALRILDDLAANPPAAAAAQ